MTEQRIRIEHPDGRHYGVLPEDYLTNKEPGGIFEGFHATRWVTGALIDSDSDIPLPEGAEKIRADLGLDRDHALALFAAGHTSSSARRASVEELSNVKGIGEATARRISGSEPAKAPEGPPRPAEAPPRPPLPSSPSPPEGGKS